MPQKQATKKPPSRKNVAGKKTSLDISGDDDFEFEDISDDDEFEVQVVKGKKGGRKPAAGNAKAAKPPAAPAETKKRGPAASSKQSQLVSQKLITDVLKPAESAGVSPEKKVRKIRASPFNKKSSSLLGRVAAKDSKDDSVSPGSSFDTSGGAGGGSSETMIRVARPQRANRTKTTYVLSDSEDEEDATEEEPFDVSEFSEDED